MKDTPTRSIAKAITWRVLATLTTFTIILILTGSLKLSLSAGLLDIIAKLIIYYFHERGWNKVKWGKK